MNLKRAIVAGIILWVLIFFEVSILMFGFSLEPGVLYYSIHYPLIALLIIVAALIYFKGARSNLKHGLILGLILAVVGLILDAAITVPLFIKDWSFFLDPYLGLGLLEIVLISGLVGKLKK